MPFMPVQEQAEKPILYHVSNGAAMHKRRAEQGTHLWSYFSFWLTY